MENIIVISKSKIIGIGIREILKQSLSINVIISEDKNILEMANSESIVITVLSEDYMLELEDIKKYKKIRNFKHMVIDTINCNAILRESIRSGVDAYLLLVSNNNFLVEAIKSLERGECYYESSLINRIIDIHNNSEEIKLSKREREVLRYLSKGNTNLELANILNITENTVKKHISSLLDKLNAKDRLNAIINARELGFII